MYHPSGCLPEESTKLKGESGLTEEQLVSVTASASKVAANRRVVFGSLMILLSSKDFHWLPFDTGKGRLGDAG